MCYTIAHGSIVNVVAFDNDATHGIRPPEGPWVVNCTPEEVLSCYAGFEAEALDILRVSELSSLLFASL